jgi:hypothetical protein
MRELSTSKKRADKELLKNLANIKTDLLNKVLKEVLNHARAMHTLAFLQFRRHVKNDMNY